MIVLQVWLMVIILRLAGPRSSKIYEIWTRSTSDSSLDVSPTDKNLSPELLKQQANELIAIRFNYICAFVYPALFIFFNIMMFGLVAVYT